jgi:hypothetical protein
VWAELEMLQATWRAAPESKQDVGDAWAGLKQVNERLWVIEDDIRECERRQDFGAEFVRLARAVYFENDERARLKRVLNERLGSRLVEEKSTGITARRSARYRGCEPVERVDHRFGSTSSITPGYSSFVPQGSWSAGTPRKAPGGRVVAIDRRAHDSEYAPLRAGLLAACSPMTGVPTAFAMCSGPESGLSTTVARAASARKRLQGVLADQVR